MNILSNYEKINENTMGHNHVYALQNLRNLHLSLSIIFNIQRRISGSGSLLYRKQWASISSDRLLDCCLRKRKSPFLGQQYSARGVSTKALQMALFLARILIDLLSGQTERLRESRLELSLTRVFCLSHSMLPALPLFLSRVLSHSLTMGNSGTTAAVFLLY